MSAHDYLSTGGCSPTCGACAEERAERGARATEPPEGAAVDQIDVLEQLLRDLDVERCGVVYISAGEALDAALGTAAREQRPPKDSDVRRWRCTLTTREGASRDGEGETLSAALVEALWSIATLRDQEHVLGEALLGGRAGR